MTSIARLQNLALERQLAVEREPGDGAVAVSTIVATQRPRSRLLTDCLRKLTGSYFHGERSVSYARADHAAAATSSP